MADNTIGWGQGSVNNTNDWGKGKANSTNDWGSIYANSPSGDTNIEGGSAVNPDAFIIQVQTDNTGTSADNQFTLPVSGAGTYDIKTPEHNLTNQAGRTILTFSSAGIYNIEIIGNTAPFKISNNSYGDRLKVIDIINFGNIPFFDYRYAFGSFTNLTTLTATDSFDFSNVGFTQASLISAFNGCSNFISGINGWNNFGIINNMSSMFRECRLFNDDITNWDVSNVTNMSLMFYGANSFNQDISSWDVSNVTNMNHMFGGFGQDMLFDQDISSWQITQVSIFGSLFMDRVTLSTANYDALLIAWDSQGAMSYSGTVNFGSSQYTFGNNAPISRASLISKWGGIIDGGLALSYDNKSFSFGTEAPVGRSLTFNADGTKMYIGDLVTAIIYQYSLSTAYDVSTSSYDNVSLDTSSRGGSMKMFKFNNDGTKLIVGNYSTDSLYQYSCSTAYDISTASYDNKSFNILEDSAPFSFVFNSNGTKLIVLGNATKSLYQYSLSTAYDITTASYDNVSFSVNSENLYPVGLAISSDDTQLIVSGSASNGELNQYTLTTASDLSTASFSGAVFNTTSQDTNPYDVYINSSNVVFVCGVNSDTVYQYSN